MTGTTSQEFRCRIFSIIATLLAASFFFWSSVAQAQTDVERAATLFSDGQTALDAKDYVTACNRFEASLALAQRPNTLFNLGQCEEPQGKLVSARKHWMEGQAGLPAKDPRIAIARSAVAALDKRIPLVTIRIPHEAVEPIVTLDGVPIDNKLLSVPLSVDPGVRAFGLSAKGHREQVSQVTLQEGKNAIVSLALSTSETAAPLAPLAPVDSNHAQKEDAKAKRRLIGYVAGGVGVAGALVAAITGGLILSRDSEIKRECPDKHCTAKGTDLIKGSNTLIAANYVGWGVGIAGIGAGTVLIVTALPSKDTGAAAPRAAIAPMIVTGGSGLGMVGSF